MSRRSKKIVGLALLGVALLGLSYAVIRGVDLLAKFDQAVAFFREAGALPFFLAMALLPALGFPLSAFTVVAGPVFGPTLGLGNVIACAILASTINVALCYWIAARAFRPLMVRLVRRLGYKLPEITPHTAWPIVLLLRIVPGPPFFLQSYLLGLAKAPFGIYMVASTAIPACYLTATIVLGDALERRDPWAIGVALALFFVAGGVIHQLRKRLSARRSRSSPSPLSTQQSDDAMAPQHVE